MANQNQSVRTCVLKVDIKCCTGCQKKASTKLQSLSGVTAVEYNAEKGLMTVTGDVEPMALVHKLTKCGKKTELVSVSYKVDDLVSDEEEEDDDTSSNPDPTPEKLETQVKTTPTKKEGILRKLLLGCFRSKPKAALQPFVITNRNMRAPSNFEYRQPGGSGFPQGPPFRHQSMVQQCQQQPQQPYQVMMQQQSQYPMGGGQMLQYNAAMPYYMKVQRPANPTMKVDPAMTVNPLTHYT